MDRRGVAPVVGVVLLVALTLLLATVLGVTVLDAGSGLDERREELEDRVLERTTARVTTAGPPAGELVWAADDDPGATDARYVVRFEVQPGSPTVGNSLNSVVLDLDGPTPPGLFAGTGRSDLVAVRVDTDGDGTTELDATGDVDGWTVSEGGTRLRVGLGGAAFTTPQPGDVVRVVFTGVSNPGPGTYDIRVQTSGDGNWQSGTVVIG